MKENFSFNKPQAQKRGAVYLSQTEFAKLREIKLNPIAPPPFESSRRAIRERRLRVFTSFAIPVLLGWVLQIVLLLIYTVGDDYTRGNFPSLAPIVAGFGLLQMTLGAVFIGVLHRLLLPDSLFTQTQRDARRHELMWILVLFNLPLMVLSTCFFCSIFLVAGLFSYGFSYGNDLAAKWDGDNVLEDFLARFFGRKNDWER